MMTKTDRRFKVARRAARLRAERAMLLDAMSVLDEAADEAVRMAVGGLLRRSRYFVVGGARGARIVDRLEG